MDAIVLLRGDHKTVEKLFKAFEKSGDEDTALKSMDASDERFSARWPPWPSSPSTCASAAPVSKPVGAPHSATGVEG
ncbi:hypothetical protein ACIRS3_28985 [Streptomyces virginiae]|uniref:hypothetical protein n=1 Tax=Streptomyces virginiae TaxID=1961 RepID=UPI003823651B